MRAQDSVYFLNTGLGYDASGAVNSAASRPVLTTGLALSPFAPLLAFPKTYVKPLNTAAGAISSAYGSVATPIGNKITSFSKGGFHEGDQAVAATGGYVGTYTGASIGSSLAPISSPIAGTGTTLLGTGVGTSIGSATLMGASIGSVVPVLGTLIGAAVGLTVGGIGKMFQGNAKVKHIRQTTFVNNALASQAKNWQAKVDAGLWRIFSKNPNFAYDPADLNVIYWLGTGETDYRGFPVLPEGWIASTMSGADSLGIYRWRGSGISPVQSDAQKAAAQLAAANAAAAEQAQLNAAFDAQRKQIEAQQRAFEVRQRADADRQAREDAATAQAKLDVQAKADAQENLESSLAAARQYLRNNNFDAADASVMEAQSYASILGGFARSQIRDMQFRISDARQKAAATSATPVTVTNPLLSSLQAQLQALQSGSSFSTPAMPGGDFTGATGYSTAPVQTTGPTFTADEAFTAFGLADASSVKLQNTRSSDTLKKMVIGAGLVWLAYHAWQHR